MKKFFEVLSVIIIVAAILATFVILLFYVTHFTLNCDGTVVRGLFGLECIK